MALKSRKVDLNATFARLWDLIAAPGAPSPVREHVFHFHRKWRFDFAWPDYLVAVEIQGGTWINGGHSRGSGFQKDCDKSNDAVLLGWRVLRYTTDDLTKRPVQVIEEVVAVLQLSAADAEIKKRGVA